MDTNISDEQLKRAQEKINNHYGEVVAFYTLRLTLAPAIEKLILLDRICYLAEQGNCHTYTLFDGLLVLHACMKTIKLFLKHFLNSLLQQHLHI